MGFPIPKGYKTVRMFPARKKIRTVSPRDKRRSELSATDWRELKKIADRLGIDKPSGGWSDAVELIIEREFT